MWQFWTVFFWWLVLACNAFYFNLPYNRLRILHFIPRAKDSYQLLYTVPFTLQAASSLGGLQPRLPLVPGSLQLPHAFYTSMYLEVIAVLYYNNHDGVIHACILKACISSKYSKCISAMKRILYTTAMYISSSSFMYLCISLYCDACLKSSTLRVGVKTLHNICHWPARA